eukprot:TRINITY_DN7296_c0_g1_i1.p1 TRINITY_DN7296_c0_g1~~TRINITY_DN7296_c0_g1_i1.p1  ORF type:complete len:360 (+),score=122.07 TRINITY_DN7296_c0_g1_i1:58-1080(+)
MAADKPEPQVTHPLVDNDPEKGDLGRALRLEKLDTDLFRSIRLWKPAPNSRAVFGGQIIGQSLVAAHRTISPELRVHSMHSYFILPGDNTVPALYHVSRVRDGRSFATRTVKATQRGRAIFVASVSFHRDEGSALDFQDRMPDVPPPEQLPTRQENFRFLLHKMKDKMSPGLRQWFEARIEAPFPLDMRNCDPTLSQSSGIGLPGAKKDPRAPRQRLWIRANQQLADQAGVHACVCAYASDYVLVSTAALPANRVFDMAASLDHSMWFHQPFRADDWMLYDVSSHRARGARALITGRLFTKDGKLAVTIAQECILRYKQQGPEAGLGEGEAGRTKAKPKL